MNMEEKKQVKNYLMGRFTWRIENFTGLNESKIYSMAFSINENRWNVVLYPKGNRVEYLSVYLEIPDSPNLPNGWSKTAEFSMALINQIDTKKTVKKEAKCQFNAKESRWGFTKLFPLIELLDKNGGYLVDDTCLIEVEVSEPDPLPVFTDKDLHSSIPDDPAESVYIKAESFLESVPRKTSIPISDAICEVPSFKEHAMLAKECFNNLISIPLNDLVASKHETAMIETLSMLSDNLSLFSDEQAKEIMNLKATFPKIIQDLREWVKVKVSHQHLWSTFQKTNNLLEDMVKTDEGIKTELGELSEREKEMEGQLDVLRSKRRRLKEERIEASKQTKQVYDLAEEQSRKIEDKKPELNLANKELEDMECKWASLKALFT